MSEERQTAQDLNDDVTAKIMRTLLENPEREYNKSELAKESEVSRDSLYKRWDALVNDDLIIEKDTRNFTLNTDSEIVKAFATLVFSEDKKEEVLETLEQVTE